MLLSFNNANWCHVICFLTLFVGISVTSCSVSLSPCSPVRSSPQSPTAKSGLTWEDAKNVGPQNMSVWGIGFDEASSMPSAVGFHTLRVESNVVITAPYHYLNRSNETQTRRLFVLLDERQQPGAIGNGQEALYSDVTVEPGSETTLTLAIPPLAPGAHDLIVVNILTPHDSPGLDYSRYTLLAGDAGEQIPRDHVSLEDTNLPLDNLSLAITNNIHGSQKKLRKWSAVQTEPGEEIEYAIYAGYMYVTCPGARKPLRGDVHRFAILTFLDYRQVAWRPGEETVFYGEVSKGTIGRILGGVQAPKRTGQHNLLILLIENPGVVLGNIVRSPDDPRPATLLPWFIDAEDVVIQVE